MKKLSIAIVFILILAGCGWLKYAEESASAPAKPKTQICPDDIAACP
jgi:hypothetical protein